jgi:hypothetical protein
MQSSQIVGTVRFPTVQDAYLYASMIFEQDAYSYASMIFEQDEYLYASMIFEKDAYLCIHDIRVRCVLIRIHDIQARCVLIRAYIYLNKNSTIEEERYRRGLVKKLLPTLTLDIV